MAVTFYTGLYPKEFSQSAIAAVDEKRIREGRNFDRNKKSIMARLARSRDLTSPSTALVPVFSKYVLAVFLQFAKEACRLGGHGMWSVDEIRSVCDTFLDRFSLRARHEKAPAIRETHGTSSGRPFLLNWIERKFHQSPEWHQFDELLLNVARGHRRSVPNGKRESAASSQTIDPGGIETQHAAEVSQEAKRQRKRAKQRSEWLARQLSYNQWTSDLDIVHHGGPSYNTIKRYRSGTKSTRDLYVRSRLALTFKCDIQKVPA